MSDTNSVQTKRERKIRTTFPIWTSLICTQWHVIRDKLRVKRNEPQRWRSRAVFIQGLFFWHTLFSHTHSKRIRDYTVRPFISYDEICGECIEMHGLQRHPSLEFIVLRKFFQAHWYTRVCVCVIHSYQNDGTKSGSALRALCIILYHVWVFLSTEKIIYS